MEYLEVWYTNVVWSAILLDIDGVPGDELRVPAREALELYGGGGEP